MLPRLEKMDLDDLQHFLIAYHGFMFEKGKNRQILQVIYDHYFQNKKLDAKDAAVVFGDVSSLGFILLY